MIICPNRQKFIRGSVLILFIFTLLTFPVLAQTPTGDLRLTASPLPINLKTTPGGSVTATLRVKNDGLQTENIKVSLMKFKADPQTGVPQLSDREPGDDYFDWVTFSEPTFTLPVNEWKTLTATFNVPTNASFGYYYAVVFSRAEEPLSTDGQKTVIQGGLATLVLLEAQVPNAKREIKVTDFSVSKQMFEFLPANFAVKLRNTGNVHVVPRGNVFISRGGQQVAILDINPNQGSILPNSPRNFLPEWSDGFPVYIPKNQDGKAVLDAKGNPVSELKWDFKDASKLRFGKYSAKMLLVYDDGQRDVPLEATVSFWVVPWRILFGTLVILIFVLIGMKSTLQNLWHRLVKMFKKE
jgi:hypothetical protein